LLFSLLYYVYNKYSLSHVRIDFNKQPKSPWRNIILGHRGGAKGSGPKESVEYIPENSVGAFEYAAAHGANGVELDVWLTKDNVAVVIHDAHIDDILNGQGSVSDLTVAELLSMPYRGLPTADDQKKQFKPEEVIPTLEQTLILLKKLSLRCVIEVKEYKKVALICAEVARLIKQIECHDTVCVGSFNPSVLYAFNKLQTGVPTCYIYAPNLSYGLMAASKATMGKLPIYISNPILGYFFDWTLCTIARPTILNFLGISLVSPNCQLISAQYAERYLSRGFALTSWTVNSNAMLHYFRELGVSPITDFLPLQEIQVKDYGH